jgi:hypothetical protein
MLADVVDRLLILFHAVNLELYRKLNGNLYHIGDGSQCDILKCESCVTVVSFFCACLAVRAHLSLSV